MSKYDVTIIGSGPGGYVAAIRCAQLGLKTAIIEKYNTLGGTCLNVGCIPSKALLDSSEHFHNAKDNFEEHGILLKDLKPDFSKMIERKNKVVDQTCKGIEFLMDKNKIDVHQGVGSFVDKNTIKIVDGEGKETEIKSDKTIIATGSKPNYFKGMEPDKKRIITSTEALSLKEIPKSMIVIGGGVIGLELGSVYARLGTKVEVVEFADSIIPTMDQTMGKELTRVLKKLKMKFNMKHKVQNVENKGEGVVVTALDKKDKEVTFEADYCLVAVGRKPYTEGLGLENVGIKTNDRGQIEVDDNLKTSADNIFAIGDVIRGAMLAHKAEEEGTFVAEKIAGQIPHINYNLIPGVVYTWPEVASVGKTEQEVKEAGIEYSTGSFPMKALGRSRASGDIQGLVKIITNKETDEILGFHMIGARAADLIMEGVVAMEYRASAEDLVRMSHPHPTYSEAIREAAMDATGDRAIHV
ncbi:dihydrolipoyl dehydrogenase [Brumimicrobium aurantiacum]|uniref:Dihydrolipoyl dehydrogenase n=1 Tax=Brumimicrobium aurantiacum TaxID=1737063 RepID=A0A3E1EY21_9FLAO|nr:dihydrolipoyl dehydrogenase [Brumimicrobium aurantiacum]RFC54456.1 dihydrolipoyl dehydrogenase [Brumimicrobium aurantiacum]